MIYECIDFKYSAVFCCSICVIRLQRTLTHNFISVPLFGVGPFSESNLSEFNSSDTALTFFSFAQHFLREMLRINIKFQFEVLPEYSC